MMTTQVAETTEILVIILMVIRMIQAAAHRMATLDHRRRPVEAQVEEEVIRTQVLPQANLLAILYPLLRTENVG